LTGQHSFYSLVTGHLEDGLWAAILQQLLHLEFYDRWLVTGLLSATATAVASSSF
jgi:hypothetical protein